jgi:hypothetical protein
MAALAILAVMAGLAESLVAAAALLLVPPREPCPEAPAAAPSAAEARGTGMPRAS